MAWQIWQSVSPAPTFGQMRELMAEVDSHADLLEQKVLSFAREMP